MKIDDLMEDIDEHGYMYEDAIEQVLDYVKTGNADDYIDSLLSELRYIEQDADVLAADIASKITNRVLRHKEKVITALLKILKANVDNGTVIVKALRLKRVSWPELNVIEKSLNTGLKEWDDDEDWDSDYGQSAYLNALLREISKGDAEGVAYYYLSVVDEISEASAIRAIANHIDPENPVVKTHLIKLLLNIMKDPEDAIVARGLIEAIRWHVDWPELAIIEKSLNAIKETKIKGADGRACWKGYRYAGTEKGKDKCIPVKKAKK